MSLKSCSSLFCIVIWIEYSKNQKGNAKKFFKWAVRLKVLTPTQTDLNISHKHSYQPLRKWVYLRSWPYHHPHPHPHPHPNMYFQHRLEFEVTTTQWAPQGSGWNRTTHTDQTEPQQTVNKPRNPRTAKF